MSGTQLSSTAEFTNSSSLGAEVAATDASLGLAFVAGPSGVVVLDIETSSVLTTFARTDYMLGPINSIAAQPGLLAVAAEAAVRTDPGSLLLLEVSRTGDTVTLVERFTTTVGVLPDMVTFTPDGAKLLTANEGEPNSYGQADSVDPVGSVSIVDAATGAVQTAGFGDWNTGGSETLDAVVRIFGPGATVAQDLEPEYIAIDPNAPGTAYVTLQEANAIGVLDIATATFTAIIPLGFKDHSVAGNEISANDQDNVFAPRTFENLFGIYNPDAIVAADIGGTTYLITANEGDARDYTGFAEESRVSALTLDPTAFPDATANAALGRLTVTTTLGDTDNDGDYDQLYTFGGRSFSVWSTDGALVFDSGNLLDEIIATRFAANYDENRDDNKGVEPESLALGTIGDDLYLFVGLERADGVMSFRIDGPDEFTFTGFATKAGDDAPEVFAFIPAGSDPTDAPALIVPNEGSNTITGYTLAETFTLQLLHFADAEAGLLASQTAPFLAAMVDAFEEAFPNTLILAGGDNFLPGPFLAAGTDASVAATHMRGNNPGAADIEIHNRIGVEASTIGNHEFDLGTNAFSDAVNDAAFPYLSANLNFAGDSAISGRYQETVGVSGLEDAATLARRIVPSAVVTKGNEVIGLVGATTQILETISSTGGVEVKGFTGDGSETNDMALLAAQLQVVIDDLRDQGVNKIILMAHLQQIAFETQLAPLLEGVDIILAAGSNTRLGDANDTAVAFPGHAADFANTYPIVTAGADGDTTLIVNTDNEFTYLGRLVVTFDSEGRIIQDSLDDTVNGAYASTAENAAAAWGVDVADLDATAFAAGTKGAGVRQITEAVQAVIDAKDGEIWGFTDVYLEGERNLVRNQETNLGNITADANLDAARDALEGGTLLASLKNGGGIRAQIGAVDVATGEKLPPIANDGGGKPEGAVSTLDIENSLRFDNRLMVFDTDAAGLKAILEHGVAVLGNQGRFPQIGGVEFSYDPDLAAGSRILNLSMINDDGTLIARLVENGAVSTAAPAQISVVALNFLANGGDGYPIKANGENFRFLLNDGSVSAPVDEALNFTDAAVVPANSLGEQQAMREYLAERYGTPDTAFDQADTAPALDTRIQDLNQRADAVFEDLFEVGGPGSGVFAIAYEGPVAELETQRFGGATGEVILGTAANDFINAGAGDDAIDGGAGDDVLDGARGSTFVTGGEGFDRFFVDARGLEAGETIWSTITDWEAGEQLALFGWQRGVSTFTWDVGDDAGAPGFTGATFYGDVDADGTIDTTVTWAGVARAELPAPIDTFDGLLWFV